MIMCFSSPYVGAESDGAPFGAKIVGAELKAEPGNAADADAARHVHLARDRHALRGRWGAAQRRRHR